MCSGFVLVPVLARVDSIFFLYMSVSYFAAPCVLISVAFIWLPGNIVQATYGCIQTACRFLENPLSVRNRYKVVMVKFFRDLTYLPYWQCAVDKSSMVCVALSG